MKTLIYNDDCRKKLDELDKVDYVFTVPPDFDELSMNPGKDLDTYYSFLRTVFDKLMKVSDVITIGITDRKFNRGIVPKHAMIINYFISNGFPLVSHKIWAKTMKSNLYRLTYTNVMTFSSKRPKQRHLKEYEPDIYLFKEEKYNGYPYGIALPVVEIMIRNFTKEGDTVLDPFSGSGTTALASVLNKRNSIGIEIKKEYYLLSMSRVRE